MVTGEGVDRRLRGLFCALALLYVLPFWAVRYIPTVDGPCHTYNAWILRQYGNVERYPLFQQYYEINARPYPNWISQGAMALLMVAVPPRIAEKLLVSGYVLLFLGSAWYLAGAVRPGERWLALLAFPFAWHQLFQFGFYNFAISVALFQIALGFWWRHRERPGLRFAVEINLLLWLCYFSHILSLALALAGIAVLWLATLRRESWRRRLPHVPILLPQIVLPIWFLADQGRQEMPATWSFAHLAGYLGRLEVLYTLGEAQLWIGTALAGLFLLLLAVSLWRGRGRREEHAFLVLAALLTLFYFISPEGMAGGFLLKQRLSLYPFLVLLPWLSPRLSGRAEVAAAVGLALAALLYLGYLVQGYRELGVKEETFLAGIAPLAPNSRVLPLLFERTGPTDFLSHAIDYVALEKGAVDWDNYEAKTAFFPVRFRDSVDFPNLADVPWAPGSYRVRPNVRRVDAVYVWRMPLSHPLGARLRRSYTLTREEDGGMLFERGGG
ncbi:MAG TPA: hypothetical protein VGM86_15180 [Thermoanaerobaculia bacterium]